MPTSKLQQHPLDAVGLLLEIRGQLQGAAYQLAMRGRACELQLQTWVRNQRRGNLQVLVQRPQHAVNVLTRWWNVYFGPRRVGARGAPGTANASECTIWLLRNGPVMRSIYRTSLALAGVAASAVAHAQLIPSSAVDSARDSLWEHRFSVMGVGPVAPPWRIVGLPGQKMPFTRFAIVRDGETSVLRMQADASYGNLVFSMDATHLAVNGLLRWRWQLERAPSGTDLRRKEGDDPPLKVCALFDMALQGMSFGEQTKLRIARALSGEPLPAATLCYVWDQQLPIGTELPNIFSPRVRYLVVSQGPAKVGQWLTVERNLASDFMRAFGHETAVLPPLLALAVGADTDNTGSSSLSYVGDLRLTLP